MNKSVIVAICGLSAAMSVALMFFGGLLYVFSYTVPMLLGIIIITVKKTFKNGAAVAVFFSVSFLSLILVTDKECVLMYALFYGYYPIIKEYLERVRSKFLSVLLKLLLFNAALFLIELLCVYIFGIPFFENGKFSVVMLVSFTAAMNLLFFMYDILLKYWLIFYGRRIEKRIKNLFK